MEKEPLLYQTWLKKVGKEKIQAFQDSFAKSFEISLCILSSKGKPLTIWSNSLLFCHYMMRKNRERCIRERQDAINYVLKQQKPHIFECYMGLTLFVCPIFNCNEIVCVAYGGGVNLNKKESYDSSKIDCNVPILAERKLKDIINLLGETFNLLDGRQELTQEGPTKNRTPKELRFLQNKLSRREIEIVELINDGLTNKEISEHLYISEKTVKTHVSNILAKLEMKDRMQLIIFCRQNNVV
ncbi:LuxR family transcriptional regulator [Thermanaerosceptrum fracticalcis]|uniref:LuxR family transcriptional regulator n=1 Tax=Thermanaerosceptrum fracticalcis TaxID=1712410 RepID=UPI001FADD01A|nr:LuxR family transcriptional regulator [Thermanaerosceptrum fracticalcis]